MKTFPKIIFIFVCIFRTTGNYEPPDNETQEVIEEEEDVELDITPSTSTGSSEPPKKKKGKESESATMTVSDVVAFLKERDETKKKIRKGSTKKAKRSSQKVQMSFS